MSTPERLSITTNGLSEEVVISPWDETDTPRTTATPRPRDIAAALTHVTDEWFEDFMKEFRKRSWGRAISVARAEEATKDLTGDDASPGFGVDPEDSARLLQLRQAIDSIGWASPADEEGGDYLARLKEIREELAIKDLAIKRALRAEAQLRTQRIELRRFNREARARNEAAHLCAGGVMRLVAITTLKGSMP